MPSKNLETEPFFTARVSLVTNGSSIMTNGLNIKLTKVVGIEISARESKLLQELAFARNLHSVRELVACELNFHADAQHANPQEETLEYLYEYLEGNQLSRARMLLVEANLSSGCEWSIPANSTSVKEFRKAIREEWAAVSPPNVKETDVPLMLEVIEAALAGDGKRTRKSALLLATAWERDE